MMSRALWKMTRLASRVLSLISFSCSAGSLSASTPLLPNASQWANPWYDSTLLVAAVIRARSWGSVR